jgi:urease accessory protein
MFTQSHGLEAFVEANLAGGAALEPLLGSYILASVGPCEALAARWVARVGAVGDLELVAEVDRRLDAAKISAEGRAASRRCGRGALALATEVLASPLLAGYGALAAQGAAPCHQAVALALALAATGADEETAALAELHACAVSLLGAALRLGACDHVGAQRLLRGAAPVMAQAAAAGRQRHWHDMGGFAPQIDIMQMRHARAQSRLFVS